MGLIDKDWEDSLSAVSVLRLTEHAKDFTIEELSCDRQHRLERSLA